MKGKNFFRMTAVLIVAGLSSLLILLGGTASSALAAAPTLFFSDLQNGPNTGWNGSSTQGAAVSVWGENCGSSGTISVGGQTLSSSNSSQVAEWGATNNVARGMCRSTFWLNSSMNAGATNITVTNSNGTSNPIPFTVRALSSNHIYFINPSSGSDSNAGTNSSSPWLSMGHSNPNNNSNVKAGDIIYLEGGSYSYTTNGDTNQSFLDFGNGLAGTANAPFAWVAYPGQTPILAIAPTANGMINTNTGSIEGLVISKLELEGGSGGAGAQAVEICGEYTWFIGNYITGLQCSNSESDCEVGVVDDSGGCGGNQYIYILGNLFYQDGNSKGGGYMHNIYINSNWGPEAQNVFIGWNEFSHEQQGSGNGGIIDCRTACYTGGGGSGCSTLSNHFYIHDNFFHDSPDEALYMTNEVGAVEYYFIYNNVMANLTGTEGGINFCNWDDTDVFYNNTLYQTATSSTPVLYFGTTSTVNSMNNIYYLNSGQPFIDFNGSPAGAFNSTNDLYYNTSVPSGSYISVTGAVTGNPDFASASTENFQLQSGSPAINAGTSAVSSVVTTDYNGLPEPPFSIGAYNYTNSGEVPSAPTGLTVSQ